MLSRKAKEHRENTEIKINIDIFYELFRFLRFEESAVENFGESAAVPPDLSS